MALFSKKMIFIKTQYKTHNINLLAIVKTFKPGNITFKIANTKYFF